MKVRRKFVKGVCDVKGRCYLERGLGGEILW